MRPLTSASEAVGYSLANFEAAAHFLWTNLEKVFAYIEESLKTVNECSSGIKEAPLH